MKHEVNYITFLGTDLVLPVFVDTSFFSNLLGGLETNLDDNPNGYMTNAISVCKSFNFPGLEGKLKRQQIYFSGIHADDPHFNYRQHLDYISTCKDIAHCLQLIHVPDVIIKVIHECI